MAHSVIAATLQTLPVATLALVGYIAAVAEDDMALLDILKPKWKHSDAEVRADAVRSLGPDEHETLVAVAREDPELKVRRIAVKRLEDPSVLAEIGRTESNVGLRKLAAERATRLWVALASSNADPNEASSALAQLDDARALAEVARVAVLAEVRSAALSRLGDARRIGDVARNGEHADTRMQALALVQDADVLRAVAMGDSADEVALSALRRLEKLGALQAVADHSKSKAVRAEAQRRVAERRPTRSRRRKREPRTRTPAEAEVLGSGTATPEPPASPVEVPPSPDPEEVPPQPDSRSHETPRSEAVVEALRQPSAEARGAGREPDDSARATAQAKDEARAAAQAERAAREHSARQRLENACGRMEELCASSDRKALSKAIKTAQKAADSYVQTVPKPARELRERFEEARRLATARVEEIKAEEDWKRWTNVPKLEELCERVEALLTLEDGVEAARQLKKARADWKSIGPASAQKADALWRRFNEICEKVYEKCKEHFEAQEVERTGNLEAKQALCEQAEALRESTDWSGTTRELKRLQGEWKAIGPVPREKADKVWKRFRAACDQFFEARNEHQGSLDAERAPALEAKLALCEAVEALVDSTDWRGTTERIKELQTQWKEIGPVPRAQADAIWKRFRGACDQFFENRKQGYAQQDAERKENLKAKQLLCEKVEALADLADPEEVAAVVRELHADWKSIGPVPRNKSDALWDRFRAASDQVRRGAWERAEASRPRPSPTSPAPGKPAQPEKREPTLMEQKLREAGLISD